MISDKEFASLRIRNFIFHVVHHGPDKPVLFDETPLGDFEGFFLKRVRDTLRGNRFVFVDGSQTCDALRRIQDLPKNFVPISKELAQDFHSRHDRRIKPGVLILMRLTTGRKVLFSLIKYDHERVVSYEIKKSRALLLDIQNSFTQSADALHKSALVGLSRVGGELVVIDRTVRKDITDFFREFLDVRRKYNNVQMSEEVGKAVYETVKAHQDTLPATLTSNWRQNLTDLARNQPVFETQEYFDKLFGAHATDAVKATFLEQVEQRDLKGEVFDFDAAAVQKAGARRYRTIEGVILQVPPGAVDLVNVDRSRDDLTIITVRTKRLLEQP